MKIFSPIRLVLAVAALMSVFSAPAFARVEININKGNVEPLPIAITDFMSSDGIGAQVSAVIAADLQRSTRAPSSKRSAIRISSRVSKTGRSSTRRRSLPVA